MFFVLSFQSYIEIQAIKGRMGAKAQKTKALVIELETLKFSLI
jgi:hypothetical protein